METFAVWNIGGERRGRSELSHLPGRCSGLVRQERVDLLIAIEVGDEVAAISERLFADHGHAVVYRDDRFALFSGLRRQSVRLVRCPVESRSRTFAIDPPGQRPVLLTAVHGRDAFTSRPGAQRLALARVVENARWAERRAGHRRSIVAGDFNVNPYDEAALACDGLHAVMSKREAVRHGRTVAGRYYDYFYSPMFRLLDAHDDRPPATFFRGGSDAVEPRWHMLDQVVIRPELIPRFRSDALRIVDAIGGASLLTPAGRPDRRVGSDHLPLVFQVDLQTSLFGEPNA